MKRELGLLLFLILILPSVFALEIKINKENNEFLSGETLLANLSGNFLENIQVEQITFYKGHGGHVRTPVFSDLVKIDGVYYIYSQLPFEAGNYTMTVKDVYFKEAGKTYTQDIFKNITIAEKLSDFTVSRGFIVSNQNFEIDLTSNIDTSIDVKYIFLGETKNITISPYDSKKILFNISTLEAPIFTIILLESENQKYSIPAYLVPLEEEIPEEIINKTLDFLPNREEINVIKGALWRSITTLSNPTPTDFKIIWEVPEEVKNIYPDNFTLTAGSSVEVLIDIELKELGNFSYLIIPQNKLNEEALAEFKIIAHVSETANQDSTTISECTEGTICPASYTCEGGSYSFTREGNLCCYGGECTEIKENPDSNWIAIILISIILIIILFFVIKKLKKKKKSSSDVLNEKREKYEQRFSPEQRRVRGTLTRE